MVARAEDFDSLKSQLKQAGRDFDRSDSLTAMPKGFAEQSVHRHAAEIRLKSLIIREDFSHEDWLSGDVIDKVERLARDAMQLLTFADSGK
jgi:uncharacterized protein (DUF2461 family)